MRPTVSLRLSVTDHCQLGCLYCRSAPGTAGTAGHVPAPLTWDEVLGFVDGLAQPYDLTKVHLTGGEPLLEPDLETLIRGLARPGRDLALTTNAQTLADRAPSLRAAGLQRVNVSLDSLDPLVFHHLTRGGTLQRTLDGIEAARGAGLSPIKLNVTVLRGYNDLHLVDLARYGLDRGCEVRFLELMPIGPARERFETLFVPAAEIRVSLESVFDLHALPEQAGRSARCFEARDRYGRRGRLGLITPTSHPFCHGCRRLRLTRSGRLITCLASGHAIDIAGWLRRRDAHATQVLHEIVARELRAKGLRGDFTTPRSMVAVGG